MLAMRSSRIAAALVALALCAPAAQAAPVKQRTNLQKLARSLVKDGAPGAVVFVRTRTGARGAASGFERLSPRVAMRVSDRYRIASVTKSFVATLVLQLEAQGLLKIDDPVERFLPGVVPNGAAITLRELLSHTSGLYNYTDDPAFTTSLILDPTRPRSPQELLSVAFSHPPLFAPGTSWSYSNTNYVVLGLVVEAVTGQPLGVDLLGRIFKPLGLRSTSFPSDISFGPGFAHGYVSLQGSPLIDVTPALNPTWAWAAGAIVSNAADVSTFYARLLGVHLLLPATQLAEMKFVSGVASGYGLGLRVVSTRCGKAYGHDGDFPGWRNVVYASANGRRVAVVMVNVDESRVSYGELSLAAETAFCSG
jgi:D-alanyl-D-alanine carboxypeptidase